MLLFAVFCFALFGCGSHHGSLVGSESVEKDGLRVCWLIHYGYSGRYAPGKPFVMVFWLAQKVEPVDVGPWAGDISIHGHAAEVSVGETAAYVLGPDGTLDRLPLSEKQIRICADAALDGRLTAERRWAEEVAPRLSALEPVEDADEPPPSPTAMPREKALQDGAKRS